MNLTEMVCSVAYLTGEGMTSEEVTDPGNIAAVCFSRFAGAPSAEAVARGSVHFRVLQRT